MKPILRSLFGSSLSLVVLAGVIQTRAKAQVVDSKKTLTLEGAERVIAAAKAEAKKNHEGGVIAVVDDGGNLMALERIDGTFAAGANISMGKARTRCCSRNPASSLKTLSTRVERPWWP